MYRCTRQYIYEVLVVMPLLQFNIKFKHKCSTAAIVLEIATVCKHKLVCPLFTFTHSASARSASMRQAVVADGYMGLLISNYCMHVCIYI